MRGQAVALALLTLTSSLGALSLEGSGGSDDPHDPILLETGADFTSPGAGSGCECVRSGTGTSADPYIISDWRITNETGVAIEARNISVNHFEIRDNTLEGDTPVKFTNVGDRGDVIGNTITFTNVGVDLEHASAEVANNIIQGKHAWGWWVKKKGIEVHGGSPVIQSNLILQTKKGITLNGASAQVLDNEIVSPGDGIRLASAANAEIRGNVIRLAQNWGIFVADSAKATVVDNEVREGQGGIIVEDATLYMESNVVFNQRDDAVRFLRSSVTMLRNNITDNWRGAFGSEDSDVTIIENRFTNNDQAGVELTRSEGLVEGNVLELNEVGIAVKNSIITLRDNQLSNNTFGFSIPYNSKQSIPLMSGNIVNGLNVDGTIDPSEQTIFYSEGGLVLEGQHIDATHGTYTGTPTVQGAVVIYDSVNVTVENNTFAFTDTAIRVQASSFVRVQNNTFESNLRAVVAVDSRIFIKDNECDIEIDPPETICFDVDGGFASVRTNIVAHVDIGIRFHAGTNGVILGNTVTGTVQAGLHLRGDFNQHEHQVIVGNNTVEANVVGMVLVNFHGTVRANVIGNQTWAGVHLEGRTNATFVNNTVFANVRGIVDAGFCSSSCPGGIFVDNRIKGHAVVGVEIRGGAMFEGDVVADNKVGLILGGSSSLVDVNASANAKVGVKAEGRIGVHGGNFSHNGQVGVEARGRLIINDGNASHNGDDGIRATGRIHAQGVVTLHNEGDGIEAHGRGQVHGGNHSLNGEAGLHFTGVVFTVTECEASFNAHGIIMIEGMVEVDIPRIDIDVNPPGIPELTDGDNDEADPLFVHDCNIVANAEFGLRASVNTVVNATGNFWGPDGPRYHNEAIRDQNVISNHAIVSPYWADRAHTQRGFLPTVGGGPSAPV